MSDAPSVFGQDQRKARKEHKCCECRSIIRVGEIYSYSHGVWDGSGASFKQCMSCDEVMRSASALSDFDEQPEFHNLSEWLCNYQCATNRDTWMQEAADDLGVDIEKISKVILKEQPHD